MNEPNPNIRPTETATTDASGVALLESTVPLWLDPSRGVTTAANSIPFAGRVRCWRIYARVSKILRMKWYTVGRISY